MENDLISREAAMALAVMLTEFDEGGWDIKVPAIRLEDIEALPAVDAEPVRHGYWIHCKGKSNLWYCSECGEKIIYNPTRKTYRPNKKPVHEVNKRCRNCGAKMDGKQNE